MEKHEINDFFEKNKHQINEKFVTMLMEKKAVHMDHGHKTEHNFREGGEKLTGIVQAALVTDAQYIVDDQADWAKERLPHEGYSLQQVKDMMTLYKDIINQEYPEELVSTAFSIIERMISQMDEP